jgi:hypothetical protein
MPLKYRSGEVVTKGDRVLLAKKEGVIEFVGDETSSDSTSLWLVEKHGGGVVISQLRSLGSVITNPEEDDDVEFVCRGETAGSTD